MFFVQQYCSVYPISPPTLSPCVQRTNTNVFCYPVWLSVLMFSYIRIMDCFLLEGLEIIFRIALTLLTIGKHDLLLLDMEGVIKVTAFYNYLFSHSYCCISYCYCIAQSFLLLCFVLLLYCSVLIIVLFSYCYCIVHLLLSYCLASIIGFFYVDIVLCCDMVYRC